MDRLSEAKPTGDGDVVVVPSARLYLAPEVHFAAIGSDAVLLDVRGDGYHCLPDGAALCRRLVEGEVGTPDDTLRSLAAAGLISSSAPPPSRQPPSRPVRSIIHDTHGFDALRDLRPAMAAVQDVRAARRGRGLLPYVALQTPGAPGDPLEVIEAGRRFWSLMPYLPIEGECLVRSALLIRFLRRLGRRADWVFGVRLCPFTAHCWVQVGDVCLNDDVERLVAYTPIMVR